MKIATGRAGRIVSTGADQRPLSSIDELPGTPGGPPAGIIAILADDIGGLDQERRAARLAVDELRRVYRDQDGAEGVAGALMQALEAANDVVCRVAEQAPRKAALGASLLAGVLHVDGLYWISVGDARLYLLRDAELVELTREQTVARHLRTRVMHGELTLAEAARAPERVGLASWLGVDPIPSIDLTYRPFPALPGDRLLLVSNGIYSALSPAQLAATLAKPPQQAAETLVDLAAGPTRGDHDGLHAIVLALPPPRAAKPSPAAVPPAPAAPAAPTRSRRLDARMLAVVGLALVAISAAAIALLLYLRDPRPDQSAGVRALPAATVTPNAHDAQAPATQPTQPLQYRDLPPAG